MSYVCKIFKINIKSLLIFIRILYIKDNKLKKINKCIIIYEVNCDITVINVKMTKVKSYNYDIILNMNRDF